MNASKKLKILERRVRSSKVYQDWVRRNRSAWCFCCDSDEGLACHHTTSLYHILLGLWNLYGDISEVFSHSLAMHQDDRVDCVTLCSGCHKKRHPGRIAATSPANLQVQDWTTIPRVFWFDLSYSTKDDNPKSLSLIGMQVLFGLGWYILNGKMESRIIELNRRRFAEILGKKPGSSFNKSFDNACASLERIDVLAGKHINGNKVEVHISPTYTERLLCNPWFFPIEGVHTNNLLTLMLRWSLSHQGGRKFYRISLDKLRIGFGIKTDRPSMVLSSLQRACESTSWVGMKYEKDLGMCHFEMRRRMSIPIFTLRDVLFDCLGQ
jgi:hypothetical protein